jgi:hypothetical protein
MARSASKGIFPRTGIVDGHIITHPNGKRYQWNSSKGVWKLKSTMIDDSNFIGPQGIPGPTGNTGATGPAGADGAGGNNVTSLMTINSSGSSANQTLLKFVNGNNTGDLPNGTDTNIEFEFNDANANFKPQVRITAKQEADTDTGQAAEGSGNFIVSTSNGSGDSGQLNENFRVRYDGNSVFAGSVRFGDDTRSASNAGNGTIKYDAGGAVMVSVDGSWKTLASSFTASGGTVTTAGLYKIHTFTSSGTFTATGNGAVDVLVVAGGGGGGNDNAGGGGAGGLIYQTAYDILSGSHTITVGGGGAGATGPTSGGPPLAVNGNNSIALGLTAIGGGRGGSAEGGNPGGASGGSGGGAIGNTDGSNAYGSGTTGQGNRGGTYTAGGGGSGGGGAGGVGQTTGTASGGVGGVGLQYEISGINTWYASGGSGGNENTNYATIVAPPGGGGSNAGAYAQAGTANTGGGGAGGTHALSKGKSGGSGIVIVRYLA